MRVEHRLPDALAGVEDQPVVLDPVGRRDSGGDLDQVGQGSGSAAAAPAAFGWWLRGITSTCVGACGLMSRNATARSVDSTTSAGMSPATILQNRQSSELMSPTVTWAAAKIGARRCKPVGLLRRATSVMTHASSAFRTGAVMPRESASWDADAALEQLYAAHWRQLVRLSVLLVRDVATAEEVVQDAFVAVHGALVGAA